MKTHRITTTIDIYETIDELSEQDRALLLLARQSLEDAYAPYSKFRVGAALRLANGEMLGGSNQENASYPLCLCAERVALAAADSRFPKIPVQAIAVTARNSHRPLTQPVTPCGACRQVIFENSQKHQSPIRLILQGEEGNIYILPSANDLLPLTFDSSFLK